MSSLIQIAGMATVIFSLILSVLLICWNRKKNEKLNAYWIPLLIVVAMVVGNAIL